MFMGGYGFALHSGSDKMRAKIFRCIFHFPHRGKIWWGVSFKNVDETADTFFTFGKFLLLFFCPIKDRSVQWRCRVKLRLIYQTIF